MSLEINPSLGDLSEFTFFLSSCFLVSSFSIYLIKDWAPLFFLYALSWIFHGFLKWQGYHALQY
jgi:hypothetical protein